jgi:hypothetical protein
MSQAAAEATGLPVGFVFTAADPYWFVDLDNCLEADGKTWAPHALEICKSLPGAAIEVSQSGRGLHIVGSGPVPTERRIKSPCGRVELYTQGRFIAFGGHGWQGDPDTQHGPALAALCAQYLQPNGTGPAAVTPGDWTDQPVPEWSGPADDDQLVERMLASRPGPAAVFGDGVTLRQLWEANAEALGNRWPDESGREWDCSSADLALAQHLAFWTGKDCERMRRLMWRSGLYREKWEGRPDYVQRTILTAVGRQEAVYSSGGKREPESDTDTGTQGLKPGFQYLTVSDQVDHFDGCVYVRDIHRVWVPDGALLKPEQFRAAYGGHVFALDNTNESKTTKSAYEAFTESQGYDFPHVRAPGFDPLRTPGATWAERGVPHVNTWFPRYGDRAVASAEPFLRHVETLLPDERDREILLSYLAACLQYAGRKFQWMVVLQGVQGNGKTMIYRALEYAIGPEYCHQLDPRDIEHRFNGYLEFKVMIFIEEMRIAGKWEIADILKPYITNDRISLQAKGQDQRTIANIANWAGTTNHKDGALKTVNDRRYCPLFTAQQEAGQLIADGLTPEYYAAYHQWFQRGGGAAAIAEYLWTRPIAVDVFGRAPKTTATAEAIRHSLGPAEQTILEAVEMEEPGFRSGLIDTARAGELLRTHGKRLSPEVVGKVLKSVGYVRHPGLESSAGRLRVDGRMVRLYARAGSPAAAMTSRPEIAKLYKEGTVTG